MTVFFARNNPVNRIDWRVAFGKPNVDAVHITLWEPGLRAMAVLQPASMVNVTAPSRASPAPKGICGVFRMQKPLNLSIQGLLH